MTATKTRTVRFDRTGGLLVITEGRAVTEYLLEEYPSDMPGRAFALVKLGPEGLPVERHDVLIGDEPHCCCKGWAAYGRCRHQSALRALIAAGRL